jgi:hypothetical protein
MKLINRSFLVAALLISPSLVFGASVNVSALRQKILTSKTVSEANTNLDAAKAELDNQYSTVEKTDANKKISEAKEDIGKNVSFIGDSQDTRSPEDRAKDLQDKQDAYDEAKANEQSMANKTLTAVTTAATGIGGMELARGLSEQNADKNAEQSMAAYIGTMRCTYAEGKQVKAGPEEIELPGANNQQLMNYRSEYLSLAKDLKARKEALGLKAGIESEEILDKSALGLYDDENVGIESGAYASLYRAQMLGSEEDQSKIDEDKSASKKRVLGGAIAAGAGVVVGVAGNALINGKIGEKIKELQDKNGKLDTADDKKTVAILKKGLRKSLKLYEVNRVSWNSLSGIGEIKTYAQAIKFGLIPHDEAYKMTAVTKTDEAIALITSWYKSQLDSGVINTDTEAKKKLCETTSDSGDVYGTWNATDETCTCYSKASKTVAWTDESGCDYVQDPDAECEESEIASFTTRAKTFKKTNGTCKIESCEGNWTPDSNGTNCICDQTKYKLEGDTCLTRLDYSLAQSMCENTISDGQNGIWHIYTCICPSKSGHHVIWDQDVCRYTPVSITYDTNNLTNDFGKSGVNILSNFSSGLNLNTSGLSSLMQQK